jgi:hypothetical protein
MQVPEMPWMGNTNSAPTPITATPSTFAIVPLGGATASASQSSGAAGKEGLGRGALLVGFFALGVLFEMDFVVVETHTWCGVA